MQFKQKQQLNDLKREFAKLMLKNIKARKTT